MLTIKPNCSVDELLIQLEQTLLQSNHRKSNTVPQLLADDFIEFGSSGRIFTKPEIIAALSSELPVQFTASQFQTRFLAPGVALVTYRALRHSEPLLSTLRSSVWVEKEGRWQMIFHQGTIVESHLIDP